MCSAAWICQVAVDTQEYMQTHTSRSSWIIDDKDVTGNRCHWPKEHASQVPVVCSRGTSLALLE